MQEHRMFHAGTFEFPYDAVGIKGRTDRAVGNARRDIDRAKSLHQAMAGLKKMAEAVSAYGEIKGSKGIIQEAVADKLLPAMADTMRRYGVMSRDEEAVRANNKERTDIHRMIPSGDAVEAIKIENQYFANAIVGNPQRNATEPAFWSDMHGINRMVADAERNADSRHPDSDPDKSLKILKDAAAKAYRLVEREIGPERAAAAIAEPVRGMARA